MLILFCPLSFFSTATHPLFPFHVEVALVRIFSWKDDQFLSISTWTSSSTYTQIIYWQRILRFIMSPRLLIDIPKIFPFLRTLINGSEEINNVTVPRRATRMFTVIVITNNISCLYVDDITIGKQEGTHSSA